MRIVPAIFGKIFSLPLSVREDNGNCENKSKSEGATYGLRALFYQERCTHIVVNLLLQLLQFCVDPLSFRLVRLDLGSTGFGLSIRLCADF